MTNVHTALGESTAELASCSPTPRLDAEVLLCHVLHTTRTYCYAYPDAILTPEQTQHFNALIEQRKTGQPIAYLTGSREFWSLPLTVTQATLIPRPATETLVDICLTLLADDAQQPLRLLDLGTGSGAIALALASERPQWKIFGSDISLDALAVAKANAQHLNLDNVQFCHSDWLHAWRNQCFNVIVSNPPYISTMDSHLQEGDVRFEPLNALVSGKDGLDALRHLIVECRTYLTTPAYLLLEHGYDQVEAVRLLLQQHGYTAIQSWPDADGHMRITGGVATLT